jgi:subtilisin-like proprotein convertase family protein
MIIHRFSFALLKRAISATMRGNYPGMNRPIGLLVVLLASGLAVFAQPEFRNAGAVLVTEDQADRVIRSGEHVTVSLALQNVGNRVASNLMATIQSGNGVSNPDPQPRNYGLLAPCGAPVAREFSFTANGPTNSLLLAKLDLADSGSNLGTVTFRFRIGPQITTAVNSNNIIINEFGKATPYPAVLSVSNAPGAIVKVSLTLSNLSHEFPDDLDILLVSPSGDAVMVMSDACGVVPMRDITITFDDDAAQPIPEFMLPVEPQYRPMNWEEGDLLPSPAPLGPYAGVMSAFNGKNANGDWKLYIYDDVPDLDGVLDKGWSLTITTIQPVDAKPTISIARGLTPNIVRVSVRGWPAHTYTLEAAPDLCQSFPLESFLMPTNGVRTFDLPATPATRFFRAATDP